MSRQYAIYDIYSTTGEVFTGTVIEFRKVYQVDTPRDLHRKSGAVDADDVRWRCNELPIVADKQIMGTTQRYIFNMAEEALHVLQTTGEQTTSLDELGLCKLIKAYRLSLHIMIHQSTRGNHNLGTVPESMAAAVAAEDKSWNHRQ